MQPALAPGRTSCPGRARSERWHSVCSQPGPRGPGVWAVPDSQHQHAAASTPDLTELEARQQRLTLQERPSRRQAVSACGLLQGHPCAQGRAEERQLPPPVGLLQELSVEPPTPSRAVWDGSSRLASSASASESVRTGRLAHQLQAWAVDYGPLRRRDVPVHTADKQASSRTPRLQSLSRLRRSGWAWLEESDGGGVSRAVAGPALQSAAAFRGPKGTPGTVAMHSEDSIGVDTALTASASLFLGTSGRGSSIDLFGEAQRCSSLAELRALHRQHSGGLRPAHVPAFLAAAAKLLQSPKCRLQGSGDLGGELSPEEEAELFWDLAACCLRLGRARELPPRSLATAMWAAARAAPLLQGLPSSASARDSLAGDSRQPAQSPASVDPCHWAWHAWAAEMSVCCLRAPPAPAASRGAAGLASFGPQDLSQVVWALATLRVPVQQLPSGFIAGALTVAEARIGDFPPQVWYMHLLQAWKQTA
jgi:hypothetical protein